MKPSLRNLLMKPPCRSIDSIMKPKVALRNSTTLFGPPATGVHRKIPNVEKHHADLARLTREVRWTCKQAIDDRWRNVLAEKVGDAIARGRLLDCVAELCAQPQRYKARYHASDDHYRGLADMADWISHDGAERQDPARHSQIADCRNGSGERGKHKVQTQGRGDDEDEVQTRRPPPAY